MKGLLCGPYRLTEILGSGGLAEVWIGEDVIIGQKVAIKLLQAHVSSHPEAGNRFLKEARSVSALDHPGIIKVFTFGHARDGRAYMAMELLTGQTLGDRLYERRWLEVTETARLMRQLASAVRAAHAHGILHRDLKPDNLFLVHDGEVAGGERIKILDFGLAKITADLAGTDKTAPGAIFGTPAYMAPEQCLDSGKVDGRADLYSIGCIMYRCLCGRPPFDLEEAVPLMQAHLNVTPLHPRTLRADIPDGLDALIMRLLAKAPEARIQDCNQLIAELERYSRVPESVPTIDSGAVKTLIYLPPEHPPVPGVAVSMTPFSEAGWLPSSALNRAAESLVKSDGVPEANDSGAPVDTERMVDLHLHSAARAARSARPASPPISRSVPPPSPRSTPPPAPGLRLTAAQQQSQQVPSMGHPAITSRMYSSMSAAAGSTTPLPSLPRSTHQSRRWLFTLFIGAFVVLVFVVALLSEHEEDPVDAATPSGPAGISIPATRSPLEALFKDIDEAYTADRFGRAALLCLVLSYTGEQDAYTDTLCAMVACRQGRATAAVRHYRKLADWQRDGVRASCKNDGTPLDEP